MTEDRRRTGAFDPPVVNGCFLFNTLAIVRACRCRLRLPRLRWVLKNFDASTAHAADANLPRRRDQFLNLFLIPPTDLTKRSRAYPRPMTWFRFAFDTGAAHRTKDDRATAQQPAKPKDSCRPLASKQSRNFARFSSVETGTVFGTVSFLDLEPQARAVDPNVPG
jgi:hypothetical protein